jgi:outer membrane lipoprotein-sorting protein
MNEKNNIEQHLEQLGRRFNAEPSVADRVMRQLAHAPIPAPARIRRIIMNLKTLKWLASAAAVIIVILVLTLNYPSGASGVAWADVAQQVQQARSFSYKVDVTMNGVMAEGQPPMKDMKMTMFFLISADYGIKMQTFSPGTNQIATEMYLNSRDNTAITLVPAMKKFARMEFSEKAEAQWKNLQKMDLRDIFKQLQNLHYTSFGRDTIDGVEVEGVEFRSDTSSTRLWSDVRNGWPVRLEINTTTSSGQMTTIQTFHDFQWNIDIDPAEFTCEIPADYSEMSPVKVSTRPADTDEAIAGLKKFVKLTGRYPDKLNIIDLMQELAKIRDLKIEETSTLAAGDTTSVTVSKVDQNNTGSQNETERMNVFLKETMPIQHLGMFYTKLMQQNMDPKYYGETVTTDTAEAVLLRWKSGENEYTVIFGDLRAKTVDARTLAELEANLPSK